MTPIFHAILQQTGEAVVSHGWLPLITGAGTFAALIASASAIFLNVKKVGSIKEREIEKQVSTFMDKKCALQHAPIIMEMKQEFAETNRTIREGFKESEERTANVHKRVDELYSIIAKGKGN